MLLPYMRETPQAAKRYGVEFLGINYGEGTQEGEFAETKNISTDKYPCLTQMAERIKEGQYESPSAIYAKGKLLVIAGTDVYYDGEKINGITVSEGKKQIATVGNYIIIYPDKKYIEILSDNEDETEENVTRNKYAESGEVFVGDEENPVKFNSGSIYLQYTSVKTFNFRDGDTIDITGSRYSNNNRTVIIKKAYKRDLDRAGYYSFQDTSGVTYECVTITRHGLQFEGSTITTSGPDFAFVKNDMVSISGCTADGNNIRATIQAVDGKKITFYEDVFTTATEAGEVTIKRIGSIGSMSGTYKSDVELQMEYSSSYGSLKFYKNTITLLDNSERFRFRNGDVISITGTSNKVNDESDLIIKNASEDMLIFDKKVEFTTDQDDGIITRKGLKFENSTITTSGTKFEFKKGDAVTISGSSISGNNKSAIIRDVSSDKRVLTFDSNVFEDVTESTEITIEREVPDLDFICENNYRLWGTKGDTIYGSKFSDPMNFQVFDGLSSDSYYIQVGSEGEFTGCVSFSTHICFFKENTLHKLYGTKPSNYQIATANVYGVQAGSEGSMHIVNEQLLYKGVNGVYAYSGGIPELISGNFGNRRYSDAVASCDGEKYYISMRQGNEWHFFSYDVLKGIWLHDDNIHAVDMAFHDGMVHYIDSEGGLYKIDKTASKDNTEWSATFCTINEVINDRKVYSKFHLRMDMSAGAWLAVDVKTDNDLIWQEVYKTHNERAKTITVPILPERCDSIDIRLRGKGECTIKTFIREFTTGSDI